jgi:hypothetical protein
MDARLNMDEVGWDGVGGGEHVMRNVDGEVMLSMGREC